MDLSSGYTKLLRDSQENWHARQIVKLAEKHSFLNDDFYACVAAAKTYDLALRYLHEKGFTLD